VASNSSVERNWSTYSFIHLAKRNKLASKKAKDLVYVHSNLRILSHKSEAYVRGPNKLWDIDPETSDFDASAATLSQLSLLGIDEEESGSFAEGRESGASGSGNGAPESSSITPKDFTRSYKQILYGGISLVFLSFMWSSGS
ncbi:hypothetical protein KI387_015209, partial [Taxus chinensis]